LILVNIHESAVLSKKVRNARDTFLCIFGIPKIYSYPGD